MNSLITLQFNIPAAPSALLDSPNYVTNDSAWYELQLRNTSPDSNYMTCVHAADTLQLPTTLMVEIDPATYKVGEQYRAVLKYKLNQRHGLRGQALFNLEPAGTTPQVIDLRLHPVHGPCKGRTGGCMPW